MPLHGRDSVKGAVMEPLSRLIRKEQMKRNEICSIAHLLHLKMQ